MEKEYGDVSCAAGWVRRIRADDPRIESCTRWLHAQSWSEEAKAQIREALVKAILASGVWDQETQAEVRQPGLAEEVQPQEEEVIEREGDGA